MSPVEVSTLIQTRRSIYPKLYSGESVPDHVIEAMLENANWAPTHKLTEPWRFVVYTGEGLKKLGILQSDLYKKVTTADLTFDEEKYENLKNKPTMASHVIAIGMMRDPKARVREIEEIEATAAAVQNMYLTATAYKVGCYWGSGGITYFEEAPALFGFDKLLGFMYVGMPKIDWPQGNRKPIDEKVNWVK